MSMLLFYVGETPFAIETSAVLRIIPCALGDRLTKSLSYFIGFLNIGGEPTPIIDFCRLLAGRPAEMRLSTRIILVQDSVSKHTMGFIAEKVQDFLHSDIVEFPLMDSQPSSMPFLNKAINQDGTLIRWIDLNGLSVYLSMNLPKIEKDDSKEKEGGTSSADYSTALLQPSIGSNQQFDRASVNEYVESCSLSVVNQPNPENPPNTIPVMVFRLGKEWLGLRTAYCKEITHRRPFHSIPHRSSPVFQGIVNLNGELRLYVALHNLLGIATSIEFQTSRLPYQKNRMMAIDRNGEVWTFPVDEVEGILQCDLNQLENVPVNISKSPYHFLKGIIRIDNRSIGLLDEETLFSSLTRSIQ